MRRGERRRAGVKRRAGGRILAIEAGLYPCAHALVVFYALAIQQVGQHRLDPTVDVRELAFVRIDVVLLERLGYRRH